MERVGIDARSDVTKLIGNTPLLFLNNITERAYGQVVCKMETTNPMCSASDRVAKYIVEQAEAKGEITPGKTTLIEASCGNTGIALAYIGAAKGYQVTIVMPENCSLEKRVILRAYGAQLVLTDAWEGLLGAQRYTEELVASATTESYYYCRQFDNPAAIAAHREGTGAEIFEATKGRVDAFVAGVGTGATVTGVAQYLKAQQSPCKIVAVEPMEARALSDGPISPHQIEGIGVGFKPANLDASLVDEIIAVNSDQAIDMARRLPRAEGLMVGISAGAAIFAACALARRPEMEGKLIVCLIPSAGERYLSTAMFDDVRAECIKKDEQ